MFYFFKVLLFWSVSSIALGASFFDFWSLDKEELAKLDGRAALTDYYAYVGSKYLEGSIYNGNEFTVKKIIIAVNYRYDDGSADSRDYEIYATITPRSSEDFREVVMAPDSEKELSKFTWNIKSAEKD